MGIKICEHGGATGYCWECFRDQRDALLAACKAALPILEHNATIVSPGHHCGDPSSSCDADCVAAARDAEMIHQVRSAIAKAEGK